MGGNRPCEPLLTIFKTHQHMENISFKSVYLCVSSQPSLSQIDGLLQTIELLRLCLLILTNFWYEHLILWLTENLKNSTFGGFYGERRNISSFQLEFNFFSHHLCSDWGTGGNYQKNVKERSVCRSYDLRETLNWFFSSRWSRIYILYRVSHVSFDLLHTFCLNLYALFSLFKK